MHHGSRLREWESTHGSLADALTVTPEDWGPELRGVVVSTTTADFVVSEADEDCLDLMAVVRP